MLTPSFKAHFCHPSPISSAPLTHRHEAPATKAWGGTGSREDHALSAWTLNEARRGGMNRLHMDGAGLESEHPPVQADLGRACAAAAAGKANPPDLLLLSLPGPGCGTALSGLWEESPPRGRVDTR